jgi:hypothetical protein
MGKSVLEVRQRSRSGPRRQGEEARGGARRQGSRRGLRRQGEEAMGGGKGKEVN